MFLTQPLHRNSSPGLVMGPPGLIMGPHGLRPPGLVMGPPGFGPHGLRPPGLVMGPPGFGPPGLVMGPPGLGMPFGPGFGMPFSPPGFSPQFRRQDTLDNIINKMFTNIKLRSPIELKILSSNLDEITKKLLLSKFRRGDLTSIGLKDSLSEVDLYSFINNLLGFSKIKMIFINNDKKILFMKDGDEKYKLPYEEFTNDIDAYKNKFFENTGIQISNIEHMHNITIRCSDRTCTTYLIIHSDTNNETKKPYTFQNITSLDIIEYDVKILKELGF